MPSTSSLCILSNLTQKIIHSKTGHIFLLYFSISDDTTCTIDLTLADTGDGGPDPDEDTQEKRERLERWWSASWTAAQLREIGVSGGWLFTCSLEFISPFVQMNGDTAWP